MSIKNPPATLFDAERSSLEQSLAATESSLKAYGAGRRHKGGVVQPALFGEEHLGG